MDAGERVANYHTIFDLAWKTNKSVKGFICPDLERARTRLGTSLSDYSLPYIIDPDVNELLNEAMTELASLFISRNKEAIGEKSDIDEGPATELKPRSFMAPPGIENEYLRRTIESAPKYMFLLDSGIMESWLGNNGRGRAFMEKLYRLFADAVDEMEETGGREETPYFLLWTLLNSYSKAGEAAKKIPLSEETREITAQALATGLHLVNESVKEQILDNYNAQLPPHSRLVLCWSLLVSPAFFLAGNTNVLKGCRSYDVPAAIFGEWEEAFAEKAGNLSSFSTFEESLDKLLASKRKIRKAAMGSYRNTFYRHAVMEVLGAGLPLDSELFPVLESFFLIDGAMGKKLSSAKSRKELVAMTRGLVKEFSKDEFLSKKLTHLALLFKNYSNWRPLKALKLKKKKALQQIRTNIAADLVDKLMAAYAREMMGDFIPQSGNESDRELDDLYSSGRLYRFGSRPILKRSKAAFNVAHFFIDLKDITKGTILFREDDLTQYIFKELYEPILSIAKDKLQELSHLDDREGISLNPLPGDAISFSGDIAGIVDMAAQVRQHLEQYAAALQKRAQNDNIAAAAEEIKKRYTHEIDACQTKRKMLLPNGVKTNGEIHKLEDREKALKKDMENELTQLSKEHFISGSFISYGASASVIKFEDSFWGRQKVSLCEKISESAKGTIRENSVIALMNQLLQLERKRRNLPQLALPFQVYVANSLALPLEPRYELALRKAFAGGKGREAYKLYVQAAQIHVKKTLSSGIRGIKSYLKKGMAIYNAGDALSGEALAAYRKACTHNFRFVDLKLPATSLPPEILSTFAFFHATLKLIVAIDANEEIRQIFHYAGAAVLKDFESTLPTEVWEMINMRSRFGQMIAMSRHLVEAVNKSCSEREKKKS